MFKLTKPCAHCPFRTDIRPFLTRGRAREISDSLLADETFPCHATVEYDTGEYDEDGEEIPSTSGSEHCAGALIVLLQMGRPNQMMRIGMRLGLLKLERVDMTAPVHPTLNAFCRAQPGR